MAEQRLAVCQLVVLIAAAALADPITYRREANTDTGKVAGYLSERVGTPDPCGVYYKLPPCNVSFLEEVCRATCGCGGFNTNGWLKGCVTRDCGASSHPLHDVDTYVGSAMATAATAFGNITIRDDYHYPAEEADEASQLQYPIVLATDPTNASVRLSLGPGLPQWFSEGDVAYGNWSILSVFRANTTHTFCVVQRDLARWGVLAFLATESPPMVLRSGVGAIQSVEQPVYDLPDAFFACVIGAANDTIGDHLLSAYAGEPTYAEAASFMAPARDYALIGIVNSSSKYSVSPDGRIKSASTDVFTPMEKREEVGPGILLFDPSKYVPWPATNFSNYKSALLGRYLRAVSVAAWDPPTGLGYGLLTFAPSLGSGKDILARVVAVNATRTVPTAYQYFAIGNATPPATSTSGEFYSHLLGYARGWEAVFDAGMQVAIPGPDGQRQVDMSRAMISVAMTDWVGLHPVYGDGGNYWSYTKKDRGSLPLTSLALDSALIQWNLPHLAAERVEYYFNTFVFPNGSINLMHWEDRCSFADGLSDYGRMLDLWVKTARAVSPSAPGWPATNFVRFEAMARHVVALVANATTHSATGMIFGPAEHDTCRFEGYYFSVSMWSWRGLLEVQRWLEETKTGPDTLASIKAVLPTFRANVQKQVQLSLVPLNSTSTPYFVPPVAGAGQTPFATMIDGTLESYSNFRYYSEMLSSAFLDAPVARSLANFRETHKGLLSGMTRFRNWLDDMPAVGYALSDLRLDRLDSFHTLMTGHIANYQSPGTFQSSEQLGFKGTGRYRQYLNREAQPSEVDLDFCVPSSLLVSHQTKFAVLNDDVDEDIIWVLRAALRRWYAAPGLSATRVYSRYGQAALAVHPAPGAMGITFSLDPTGAGYLEREGALSLVFRVRDPAGKAELGACTCSGGDVVSIDRFMERVIVEPSNTRTATVVVLHCTLV